MLAQTATMILVRVADEQRIDAEPSRGVAYQLLPKLGDHVGSIVIGIIGGGPDIHIDQYPVAFLGLDERHVAIADGKERKLSSHRPNLQNGTRVR